MTDYATLYRDARHRITDLVHEASGDDLARTVPGCPEWTVCRTRDREPSGGDVGRPCGEVRELKPGAHQSRHGGHRWHTCRAASTGGSDVMAS